MKKLLRIAGILLTGLMISAPASAQPGRTGLGLRLSPDGAGFTGKFFVDRNLAIEAQLNAGGAFAGDGQSVTAVGLLEYHIPLPDPSWRVFFGGGAHMGTWDHRYKAYEGRHDQHNREFIAGIDGVGGVEYLFKKIPLGLSADFKPAINLASEVDFFPHNMFGISARIYLR